MVVPFEKLQGNLFGLSNEPFVSKPARHKEHSKDNPQLKNHRLATVVHDVLEMARAGTPAEVEAMLVEALRIGRERASSRVLATLDMDANLQHVLRFADEFVKEADGGARLPAVAGTIIRLLSETFTVKIHPPSASDAYARTVGDIEVFSENVICAAYECKQRPVTLNDINHGIRKAQENNVPEYCFLYTAGLVRDDEARIRALIGATSEERDVSLVSFDTAVKAWAVMLNPTRRARLGETIAAILRDEMRRSDIADVAAELWNSLE